MNPFPRPSPRMLNNYHKRLAKAYTGDYAKRKAKLKSVQQWEVERARLLAAYQHSLGLFPAKTPLNARVVGELERPGVRIQKIIFESRPKFYVTANLYLPDPPRNERAPAVLLLSGHYQLAKLDPTAPHQLMATTLARAGVVVLATDPPGQGERSYYLNDKGESRLNSVVEHSYLGYPGILARMNLMSFFAWDAIRAVDYLIERPEVDPARIAATGVSGGGTQTFCLAPLEPRVSLLAPTCSLTSRYRYLGMPADPEQCQYGAIRDGLEQSTLAELAAPRPYQIQAAVQDFFPIQGTRESCETARAIYRIYGAEDRLNLVEDDCTHEYSANLRKGFYQWLNRWFKTNVSADDEANVSLAEPQQLQCTSTGQIKSSYPDSRWIGDFTRERVDSVKAKRTVATNSAGLSQYQAEVREAMSRVLQPLSSSQVPTKDVGMPDDGASPRTVWLNTEPGITATLTVWFPSGARSCPTAILIEDTGSDEFEDQRKAIRDGMDRLRADLVGLGYVVAIAEVRGIGDSAPAATEYGSGFIMYNGEAIATQDAFMCGTSLFGGRLRDIQGCLSYLRTCGEVDEGRIAVIGWGQGGLLALSAAATDPKIAACADIGGLSTYERLARAELFAHPPSTFLWDVLSHYDLPAVAACVAPRPLLLAGITDEMKKPLPEGESHREYAEALAAYRVAGAESALRIEQIAPDIGQWLREALRQPR